MLGQKIESSHSAPADLLDALGRLLSPVYEEEYQNNHGEGCRCVRHEAIAVLAKYGRRVVPIRKHHFVESDLC